MTLKMWSITKLNGAILSTSESLCTTGVLVHVKIHFTHDSVIFRASLIVDPHSMV